MAPGVPPLYSKRPPTHPSEPGENTDESEHAIDRRRELAAELQDAEARASIANWISAGENGRP